MVSSMYPAVCSCWMDSFISSTMAGVGSAVSSW